MVSDCTILEWCHSQSCQFCILIFDGLMEAQNDSTLYVKAWWEKVWKEWRDLGSLHSVEEWRYVENIPVNYSHMDGENSLFYYGQDC